MSHPDYLIAQQAVSGDKKSLEELLVSVKDKVYNISLRFLWQPADAEDATQEILIRIITNLSSYRGESSFFTWSYRVAVNYLLNRKKNGMEMAFSSFQTFADDLSKGFDLPVYDNPDKRLLEQEVKIGCTLGMLLCLTRELRLAFILGTVFELNSNEAAEILDIKAENFRKRLSLARKELDAFMNVHCGLVNTDCNCRCHKRISYALAEKRIDKNNLLFSKQIQPYISDMEELHEVAAIYNSHPEFHSIVNIHALLRNVIGWS